MLISIASVKGSPGVTSTALALAAVWPRPVVLLEADPSGGDLAYRCKAAHGGPVAANQGLLQLAAAVRGGLPGAGVVVDEAQLLACGVNLVQGVTRAGQARAFSGLWPTIASACVDAEVDVIADLGRLDRTGPVMPLAEHSTHLLTVAAATLESVMHLREDVQDFMGTLAQAGAISVCPVLVGPDARAGRDRSDLDNLLDDAGIAARPTLSMPNDSKALARLEQGESPSGRLGRTLLMRGAKNLAASLGMTELISA
ncbi:MAG: hypothetical protein ABIR39_18505 [Nocardioides sp.]|uniref:hypothetical protein n=1 Tax=Nocardioides sp. TaxID=35761 RepID=UPI003267B314